MMVELRLWEDKDASLLQVYADNPHIAKHMREGFPSPFTLNMPGNLYIVHERSKKTCLEPFVLKENRWDQSA